MNTSISSLKYAFVQNYNIVIAVESGREKTNKCSIHCKNNHSLSMRLFQV